MFLASQSERGIDKLNQQINRAGLVVKDEEAKATHGKFGLNIYMDEEGRLLEIDEFDGDRQKLVLTGKAGEGACVDTCRCLHYGSRGNSKARIVMMLRFRGNLKLP